MGVRITDLPIASSSSDTDILPVVQEGTTKQMQKSTLFTDVNNSITEINTDLGELDDKIDEAIAEFTAPLTYKGEVTNVSDLPSGATQGDIYTVTSVNKNYIWNGTEWVEYSPTMDLSSLTNTIMTTPVAKSQEITDCAGVNGKLNIVDGDTYQATRDGKNLINVRSDTDITIDSDDWITYSTSNTGSSTTYKNFMFVPNLNLALSSDYYLVLEIKSISSNIGTSTITISNNNTTSRKGQFLTNKAFTFNNLQANDIKIEKVTTRDSFDGCETFSRSYIGIAAGDTVSVTFRLSALAQEPTAETFVYEPYGVSPSPDYPSDIQNVGDSGSIDFKVKNANLFYGTLQPGYQSVDGTIGGSLTIYRHLIIEVPAGRYKYKKFDSDTSFNIIRLVNLTNQTNLTSTFTLTEKSTLSFSFRKIDNTDWNVGEDANVIKFMVYKSTLDDSNFIEAKQQTIQFPLSAGQLLHKGDYLTNNGIYHKRGTFKFDGTESWTYDSTSQNVRTNVTALNFKLSNDARINCNRLKSAAKTEQGFNSVSSNSLYIKINGCTSKQNYIDKLGEWNTQGNPLTFEDDYVTPVTENYTTEQAEVYYQLQNLLLYKGYTLIECIDTMQPDIQVDYLYNNDINNYYGSRLDAIEARLRALEQS